MKHLIHRPLVSHKLCERYLGKSVLDDLVKPDKHRSDAAVAVVNARIEHARVAPAVLVHGIVIEHSNDLAQANVRRGPCKHVTALGPTRRLHKTGLIQQPHQLAGIGGRDALAFGDLRQRQAVPGSQGRELHQTAKPIFLLRRDLHNCSLYKNCGKSLLLSQD